ncbi:PAS domain S-box protein, partial [Chloroflexota bacterium]
QIIGMNSFEFIAEKDRAAAMKNMEIALEVGQSGLVGYNLLRKDGSEFPGELSASVIRDMAGNPINFIAVVRDITERKRIEERLQESEQQYRLLADNVTDVIWTMDLELNLTYISPSVTRQRGYEVEEALSESLADILTPASLKAATEALGEGLVWINTGDGDLDRMSNVELEMRHKDGSTIWTETTANILFDQDGVAVGLVGISRDITERRRAEDFLRESEEKLRLIYESVPEGIIITDLEGKILDINDGLMHMRGCDTKEDIIGMSCYELFAERDRVRVLEMRQDLVKTGSSEACRYSFMTKDGSEFPVTFSAAVMRDASGQSAGIVAIGVDMTQQQKMQEQLILANRLASVGQLAAGIAHEINNPLTGVIGVSRLLIEKDLSDEIRGEVEIIENEARRAANIVDGLRTFAQDKGARKVPVDINGIIQEVLQLRSHEQRASNIKVDERYAFGLPYITASGAQMRQVIVSLIINAEQAIVEAHGRGKLTVTTEEAGDMVRVAISDDGPGISPESMKNLFTPFFTTKGVGKGTGLGLSICHGIVTEHGGTLTAESEPGRGATFIIELPVAAGGG